VGGLRGYAQIDPKVAADNVGASDKKLEPIRNKGPKYQGPAVSKNDPRPCGNGKKYKARCGKK
jgi:uncharacterized protein YecA (UPF0149 family)